jgi:hypothetical protein
MQLLTTRIIGVMITLFLVALGGHALIAIVTASAAPSQPAQGWEALRKD